MSLLLDWLMPKNYLTKEEANKLVVMAVKNSKNKRVEGILSLYRYKGSIKDLIVEMKYNFVSDIADDMANLMARIINEDFPNLLDYWRKEKFVMVPVPLHWKRENWRGFNQAELVGKILAKNLSLEFCNEVVWRKKDKISQVKLKNKKERKESLRDVFEINKGVYCGKKIIIFDDVITTGGTLEAIVNTFPADYQFWGLSLAG